MGWRLRVSGCYGLRAEMYLELVKYVTRPRHWNCSDDISFQVPFRETVFKRWDTMSDMLRYKDAENSDPKTQVSLTTATYMSW